MDCKKKECSSPCENNQYTLNDNLEGMPLAMAYVPWQQWQKVFDAHKGFECGTIFEELVLPFCGVKAACSNKQPYSGNTYGRRCNRI